MPARTLKELLALQPPTLNEVIKPGILTRGGSLLLYGDPATFKSWMVIDLAIALAEGKQWLIFETVPSKVLIFQAEQDEFDYQDRFIQVISSNGKVPDRLSDNLWIYNERELKLDHFYGQTIVTAEMERIKPQVLIIDNLSFSISGSEKDELHIKRFLDYTRKFQQKFRTSIVVVHHTRKEGESDKGMQEASGAYLLSRWADTIIRTYVVNAEVDLLSMDFQKQKNARTRQSALQVQWNRSKVHFDLNLKSGGTIESYGTPVPDTK